MDHKTFEALLNAWQDGETTEDEERMLFDHAETCEDCAGKLEAERIYRRVIGEMDAEPTVPLKAQAAWRGAIRMESKRARRKLLARFAAVAAAICLLTIGVVSALNGNRGTIVKRIETDGIETMVDSTLRDASAYSETVVVADDLVEARSQLTDIIDEYMGSVDFTEQGDTIERVYVTLPKADDDFVKALESLGEVRDAKAGERICVVLEGK